MGPDRKVRAYRDSARGRTGRRLANQDQSVELGQFGRKWGAGPAKLLTMETSTTRPPTLWVLTRKGSQPGTSFR
jgi:hypothetical protein